MGKVVIWAKATVLFFCVFGTRKNFMSPKQPKCFVLEQKFCTPFLFKLGQKFQKENGKMHCTFGILVPCKNTFIAFVF